MNIFDFIKSQIAILDLIQEYTSLKKAGVYWKGLCPFHGEKTPSFSVSPHRQIFYCFGCHESGDVIGFIAKIENCSQIDAAKFIADRYNMELPESVEQEYSQGSSSAKEHYFNLCEVVTQWCKINLDQSNSAQEYLNMRKINTKIITDFNIGYFPKGPKAIQSLIKFTQKNGFLASDLADAQIIKKNNQNFYSGFEDRIIFPIQDHLGRFCAFGGRIFKKSDDRVKYYNSHEHVYFNKRATLFGLNLAKKEVKKEQSIFLVEGYTDCVAMHKAGFKNTVATLGTACTVEHIDIIARLADKVYVLYDSDKAGIQAVEKITALCWNANLDIKVVQLPAGEDPGSLLNKENNLAELINYAVDIYNFVIAKSAKQFSSQNLSKKVNISQKIVEMINKVSDPLKRSLLIQDAARALGVPMDSLKTNNQTVQSRATTTTGSSSLEEKLFTAFINDPSQFKSKYYYLSSYLESPAKDILQQLIKLKSSSETVTFEILMSTISEEEQGFVRKSLLAYNGKMSSSIDQNLALFHKKHWKNIVSHIKSLLVQEKSDQTKIKEIIKNFQILKAEIVDGGLK
jgi:DNA primase